MPLNGGSGLWEFRIDYGPGYRVYFGKEKVTYIILLVGGNKDSQQRDKDFKEYLHKNCKSRNLHVLILMRLLEIKTQRFFY